jgi:hypothetical protein
VSGGFSIGPVRPKIQHSMIAVDDAADLAKVGQREDTAVTGGREAEMSD